MFVRVLSPGALEGKRVLHILHRQCGTDGKSGHPPEQMCCRFSRLFKAPEECNYVHFIRFKLLVIEHCYFSATSYFHSALFWN